jgi:hypothetical protein
VKLFIVKKFGKDQQQLACTLAFTVWHLTQTSSVSLQLSLQRGYKEPNPAVIMKRTTHQTIAVDPTVFLGMFPVSLWQVGQGEPIDG